MSLQVPLIQLQSSYFEKKRHTYLDEDNNPFIANLGSLSVPLDTKGKGVSIAPPNSNTDSPQKPKLKHTEVLQISKVAIVGMHGRILKAEDVQHEIQLSRDANRRLESLNGLG